MAILHTRTMHQKRTVEVLHRMGLLITYEIARRALQSDALAIKQGIKEKAWTRALFSIIRYHELL